MENRAHALAAGLFAIVLGAGIVFAIWWFSDQRVPMRELVLEAHGDINGLGEQSRVRYRGMAVGSVRAIGIDPADLRTLLVRIAVPADLPIPKQGPARPAPGGKGGGGGRDENRQGGGGAGGGGGMGGGAGGMGAGRS